MSQRLSSTPVGAIRVVLADDHGLLRHLLKLLLDARPEVDVVGDCADGRSAVALCEQLRPAVVLMDIAMPELNGIDATSQILRVSPATRVIIVSGFGDQSQVREAIRAGASGYVIKRSEVDELVTAIDAVGQGKMYFSSELAGLMDIDELVFQARNSRSDRKAGDLTPREREVLQLFAEGRTAREVAARLVVSVKTVESHSANLMTKLGARNRTELIRSAMRAGLVRLDDPLATAASSEDSASAPSP